MFSRKNTDLKCKHKVKNFLNIMEKHGSKPLMGRSPIKVLKPLGGMLFKNI